MTLLSFNSKISDSLRGKSVKIEQTEDETLKRILSLFEVSYEQFKAKTFEEQYDFQHDLLSAMLPVMYKHFDKDGYGDTERMSFEAIIVSLENYRDDYYEQEYADTTLRETFMKNPPEGYTSDQIKKMSPDELIGLDMYLQSLEYPEDEDDPFSDYSMPN